jgi:membrane-bound lytic murein transglycosylase D
VKHLPIALALAAALAAPAALHAQDRPPRDTIVILPRGQEAAEEEADTAAADTLRLDAEGRPARRPARRPFEVRSSGRAAPHGPPRDVVWMHPDSIRRARGADADSAAADTVHADSIAMASADDGDSAEDDDENVVVLDVSDADDDRPARRRNTGEEDAPASRRRNAADADEPATTTRRRAAEAEDEDAEAPPRRASSRATGRDSAAAPRRAARTTERADTASARRTTRAAARDTAGARRTPPRDTASTRRTTTSTPATRTASGRPRSHTVASGETFFGIARRYGVTSAQLRAINPDVDWERLPVGTELRLPAGARNPAQSGQRAASANDDERPATRPAATQQARGRRTHTVAQGETLFGIARRYGVTVDAIREANELEGDRVRIGQTLTIPRAPQR